MGQKEHLEAIKNDKGTRLTTYKTLIRGWTEPEGVCVANYTAAPYLRATMPRRRLTALTRFRTGSQSINQSVTNCSAFHYRRPTERGIAVWSYRETAKQ